MVNNLDYIEFWATRHCNLNCKGCSACSPIKQKWFLNLSSLSADLSRMKFLDINILNINVLGGEPLLHPKITEIFSLVKNFYPHTNLGLLTNGLLLPTMPEDFWHSCQEFNVMIKVTCLPIMSQHSRTELEKILQRQKLRYHLTDKKRFNKILVLNNKSKLEDIVKNCGCKGACQLFNGHVSRCTVPMVVQDLNSNFGVNFLTDGQLDIYSVKNGREVIDFLVTPNDSCKNCSARTQKVDWKVADSCPKLSDWLVDE